MVRNKIVYIILISSIFASLGISKSYFKPNYSFSNISVNYLDWSKKSETQSAKEDFAYLEFEGGAGWNSIELYTFIDIENPTKKYDEESGESLRVTFKPIVDIKIIDNLNLHIQDYNLQSKNFFISNLVTGVSYKLTTDFGLWIKPFFGVHYQESTYYSGLNGYMFGWVFEYKFNFLKQNFSFAQWHECTLLRDKKDGYGDNIGRQGSLSFWLEATRNIKAGLQYRYASYELGSSEFNSALIYSIKYNF